MYVNAHVHQIISDSNTRYGGKIVTGGKGVFFSYSGQRCQSGTVKWRQELVEEKGVATRKYEEMAFQEDRGQV